MISIFFLAQDTMQSNIIIEIDPGFVMLHIVLVFLNAVFHTSCFLFSQQMLGVHFPVGMSLHSKQLLTSPWLCQKTEWLYQTW